MISFIILYSLIPIIIFLQLSTLKDSYVLFVFIFFFKSFPGHNNQGSNNIKKKKRKKLSYKSAKNVPNISTNNELSEQEKAVVVSSLHRVLKPFLLRRIKSDVILDLPQKVVKKYFCSIRWYIRRLMI